MVSALYCTVNQGIKTVIWNIILFDTGAVYEIQQPRAGQERRPQQTDKWMYGILFSWLFYNLCSIECFYGAYIGKLVQHSICLTKYTSILAFTSRFNRQTSADFFLSSCSYQLTGKSVVLSQYDKKNLHFAKKKKRQDMVVLFVWPAIFQLLKLFLVHYQYLMY